MMRGGELRDGARPPGGEQRRDGHARPSPAGKKVLLESGAPSILDSWCLDIWLGDFLWELVIRVQQFARCLCDWNMNANGLPNDLVTQFLMQCCSQQFVRYHYDMALLGACGNTWMYLLAFVLSIPNQIRLPYLTWWTSAYGHELSGLLLLLHSGTCECVTYLSTGQRIWCSNI